MEHAESKELTDIRRAVINNTVISVSACDKGDNGITLLFANGTELSVVFNTHEGAFFLDTQRRYDTTEAKCPNCDELLTLDYERIKIAAPPRFNAHCDACGWPCACGASCVDKPCRGACGCKMCHNSYQDFLSAE